MNGLTRMDNVGHASNLRNRFSQDERPFQCMICQRKFISKSSLSSHHFDRHAVRILRIYYSVLPFGTFYLNPTDHLQPFPPLQEKNFGCGTCGLQFGRASRLQQHLATHLVSKCSALLPVERLRMSHSDFRITHL